MGVGIWLDRCFSSVGMGILPVMDVDTFHVLNWLGGDVMFKDLKIYDIENNLRKAIHRGDTQGAKEIIRMQSVTVNIDHVFEYAVRNGNFEIIKYLEPCYEDLHENDYEDYEDEWGNFVEPLREIREKVTKWFMMATYKGHYEIARYIVKEYGLWIKDTLILLEMHRCGGHQKFIDDHINECESKDDILRSVIKEACNDGDLKAVKYFVNAYKLDIKFYEDSILKAALGGHLPVVKYLVNNGADLSLRHNCFLTRENKDGICIVICVESELGYLYRKFEDGEYNPVHAEPDDDDYFENDWEKSELEAEILNLSKVRDYLWELMFEKYPECFVYG